MEKGEFDNLLNASPPIILRYNRFKASLFPFIIFLSTALLYSYIWMDFIVNRFVIKDFNNLLGMLIAFFIAFFSLYLALRKLFTSNIGITIKKDGFVSKGFFIGINIYRWKDVSEFVPYYGEDSGKKEPSYSATFIVTHEGVDIKRKIGAYGLDGEQFAKLMNHWRNKALK